MIEWPPRPTHPASIVKPSASLAAAILQAVQLHQGGRLAEAEAIYRRILARHPRHPDALHLLGLIAQQSGDSMAALTRIDEAISINDQVAEYHHNRAIVPLAR